nr:immunoglobulin light chain junction region [Macaca mulatta]MOX77556.1 immunoglobulin light chain junction region [Macaca mulatta]MOX77918.1 immunoglobulin light chain junction region [Macaca mulatta]MOX78595.1 immunoglobulin light chain junction region [Macaca mulatta]MOX80111.1 immunoglobulin light chain junction region [Macaca mulatta]
DYYCMVCMGSGTSVLF